MTHDEAEDIMNDLAKDKRVIDVDEKYERRSACRRTPPARALERRHRALVRRRRLRHEMDGQKRNTAHKLTKDKK